MLIVRVHGGLGNQLFQYVAIAALRKKFGDDVFVDLLYYQTPKFLFWKNSRRDFHLDRLGLNGYKTSTFWAIFFRILSVLKIKLCNRLDEPSIYDIERKYSRFGVLPLYVFGYFQTEEIVSIYQNEFVDEIDEAFRVYGEGIPSLARAREVVDTFPGAVAIQVRRGDYESNALNFKNFGLCNKLYFSEGLKYLSCKNSKCFIFSDTMVDFSGYIVNVFHVRDFGLEVLDEFCLLASFDRIVISNSSFGWWAAQIFSRRTKKTVVAPEKWFIQLDSDLSTVPNGWKRLSGF